MIIGRVHEIWRYPVKSTGGEKIESCKVELLGIPGDRSWRYAMNRRVKFAVRKYLPKLMQCSSRTVSKRGGKIPHVDTNFR